MKKKRIDENFLDFVPMKNPAYEWDMSEKGIVTVHVVNTGFYNKMAQKFFHRPKISHIDLDQYGSYIWGFIDGVNTVHDISREVEKKFGKKAEPLLNRLVAFLGILHDHKFIFYKGRDKW